MTTRSKFVFQSASPVREQSVQNVVLVPQNPLEQIVVQLFFRCKLTKEYLLRGTIVWHTHALLRDTVLVNRAVCPFTSELSLELTVRTHSGMTRLVCG